MNVTENCIPAHNMHLACLINMLFAIEQTLADDLMSDHNVGRQTF